MSVEEAADLLGNMYENAPRGEQVTSIHVFGIIYADAIRSMPKKELAKRAGICESYYTEISKGIRLAEHVQLKPNSVYRQLEE